MTIQGANLQTIPFIGLFEALFAILFVLLIFATITYAYFRRLIRTCFPAAWMEMGAPTFLTQSISGTWQTFRYVIWSAKYKEIPDKRIQALGDTVRVTYVVFMGVFLICVLLFFTVRSQVLSDG